MARQSKEVRTPPESNRGKRISLAPVPFEAALGALMQVPPPAHDPTPPKRKKKRAKKARREK
jgi:hypothetical protein